MLGLYRPRNGSPPIAGLKNKSLGQRSSLSLKKNSLHRSCYPNTYSRQQHKIPQTDLTLPASATLICTKVLTVFDVASLEEETFFEKRQTHSERWPSYLSYRRFLLAWRTPRSLPVYRRRAFHLGQFLSPPKAHSGRRWLSRCRLYAPQLFPARN